IRDVHGPVTVEQSPVRHVGAGAVALPQALRHWLRYPVEGDSAELFAVPELQTAAGDAAQVMRFLQYRLKYGLKIAGRGIDHLQDLGGGRLLFQCLACLGDESRV